jgi:hypothetical protein
MGMFRPGEKLQQALQALQDELNCTGIVCIGFYGDYYALHVSDNLDLERLPYTLSEVAINIMIQNGMNKEGFQQ